MAGIAIIAKQLGHDVSGSDKNLYDPMKSVLIKNKIRFIENYNSSVIKKNVDLVIVGNVMTRGIKIIEELLSKIQENLFIKAKKFREDNSSEINNYEDFKKIFKSQNGFVYAHWDGSAETENKIKKETKATIRCIPMDYGKNPGKCIVTGKKSNGLVVFGKAY